MDNSNSKYLRTSVLIALLNLMILLYIKYSQNGLTLSDFNFFKTGNLINILITFVLIFSLFLIKKKNVNLKNVQKLSYLYFLPLIAVLIIKALNIRFPNNYLFGYPYKKIIPLLLFLWNQVIILFIISMGLTVTIKKTSFSYLTSAILVVLLITVLVLISFGTTFLYTEGKINKEKPYDIGIILGAAVWSGNKPSPIFKGRIDKGFELYQNGIIKKIQLTGANAPGEISEARAAINYLTKKKNIDKKNIFIEETTTTTIEQIKYIKEHLATTGEEKKIVFISDKFHLKRILEMADFFNIKAFAISSGYKLTWKKTLFYRFRDSIGLLLFWVFAI